MFPWDFAETIFSRWAIKRMCKFLLKKKLGDFILGDIDIDQLEVQLTRGTIQLRDVAVNVDYINQKLVGVGAAVVLKEGSIASLSIKIPWKLQNCEIELEELELVLAPFIESKIQVPNMRSESRSCEKQGTSIDPDKIDSISPDIHEGVKKIAKIVKWILTSFHIRLKKLIVAFDPCLEGNENISPVNKSLVLRIEETEFGTCLSEDVDRAHIFTSDCIIGMEKLTNFIKFEGAVIEVLQMTEGSYYQDSLESICNECSSGSSPFGSTTEILSGKSVGIAGRIDISIPWKNGFLDIHKVDASVFLDAIELRLQPCTIEWILNIWESLKSADKAARSSAHLNGDDSSNSNFGLQSSSSFRNPVAFGTDIKTSGIQKSSEDLLPDINGESFPMDLFSRTHVIQDWVPLSFRDDQDYGTSIDEFFECFDGLRSSQASSGSSGLWNWTCSVFSAINVASNLASGSTQLPTEQHVETFLQANVAGVSLFLYFDDNEEHVSNQFIGGEKYFNAQNTFVNGQSFDLYRSCFSSMNADQLTIAEPNSTDLRIHHLKAQCQDVAINFQMGSQRNYYQISFKHAKINEYYDYKCHDWILSFSGDCMLINKNLKQKINDVLPSVHAFNQEYDPEMSPEHNVEKISKKFYSQEFIKALLMESFGDCSFQCAVSLADLDASSSPLTSFSVHLPPCILWLHFHLVYSLLNLFKKFETCFKYSSENRDPAFDELPFNERLASPSIKSVPTGYNMRGNIVLSHTRIIVCIPQQCMENFHHLYHLDKFIILEHSPLHIAEEVLPVSFRSFKQLDAQNDSFNARTISLKFDVGSFGLYLIHSVSKDKADSALKVISLTNKSDYKHSGISIICQMGPATGPWIASRAWSMASTYDHRSCNKVAGNDGEFSSVSTVGDLEEINSEIRQELILSSKILLNLNFSIIQLNLHSHNYREICYILDIVEHSLNGTSSKSVVFKEDHHLCKHDASQIAIVIDYDNLDLCVTFDEVPKCSDLVQRELVGSWDCFKVIVKKIEIMSVFNIGGICGTNLFRLVHGESLLHGSINNGNDHSSKHVLLISCMNSCSRRGGGDGANAMSYGPAGSTVTYLSNSQLSLNNTSIITYCWTIVAPGGRLDWISHICSFFSSPFDNELSGNDVNQAKPCSTCESSLFVDLVDVALCYEPHFAHSVTECDDTFELNQGTSERLVGCLLAAASLSLLNYAISNSVVSDFNIQLLDLGILIGESDSLKADKRCYDVSYLQKASYAKVASSSLLKAVLKIQDLQWEVECSDSHINFNTYHSTTHRIFRLITQLQHLFAPDLEDVLAHLQSRWNSIQQSQNSNGSTYFSDCTLSSLSLDAEKRLSRSDEIKDAFHATQGSSTTFNSSLVSRGDYDDDLHPYSSISLVDGISHTKTSYKGSFFKSELGNAEIVSKKEEFIPPLIENNYFSDIILPSLRANQSPTLEDQNWKYDLHAPAGAKSGNGRWYQDDHLMVVDNHIPNSKLIYFDDANEKGKLMPAELGTSTHCREKGKVIFRNIDIRWSMFSELDSSKQKQNSSGKNETAVLELILSGLNVQYILFPEGEVDISKLSIHMEDFHLYDRSANAPWKMVLGHYNSKNHPRESFSKAFNLELETVRQDPVTPIEDYRLYLELLPIRLHLDQSQINFLINFFDSGPSTEKSPRISKDAKSTSYGGQFIAEEALLPFFQKCDVMPLIVRIDYIPRHMDLASLRGGNYVELLNLVPWKGIDLQLKHVSATRVYGWAGVCETVVGQWLEDISHNQVHKLLKGLAPIRSLVSVASGTSKLVTLPVKSYKRDKKLLKGMQRGAIAFVKSISLEAVGLGVHLTSGVHEILLQTEFILRNIPLNASSPQEKGRLKKSASSNQPEDAHDGIRQAYESLSDGLSRTASALLGTPIKEYRRGAGAGSALATAVRGAPAAAIAPVTASAHAMHCALLGMRNSLDPEHKKESMNKYLGPSRP